MQTPDEGLQKCANKCFALSYRLQPNKLLWVLLQITGGHKYLPPRQDVNAPDLYIPFMAVCTFCLLASVSKLLRGIFTPESMYAVVRP